MRSRRESSSLSMTIAPAQSEVSQNSRRAFTELACDVHAPSACSGWACGAADGVPDPEGRRRGAGR
eukprot:scaffold269_cov404-Prasinococcus_capsulatus_cf.AAC.28